MEIKWFGHACFEIKAMDGTVIVTDPFDESIGYTVPEISADVVTVSHDHFDHNNVSTIKGEREVVKGEGEHFSKNIRFYGVKTHHDKKRGAERGSNIVFLFDVDTMRICHLGDLGHVLEEAQLKSIKEKEIDILLIPVGSVFTIDAKDAEKVVEQLKPKIAVPMHYKTPPLQLNIEKVDKFLKGKKRVREEKKLSLSKEDLPEETEIVVLDWKH